MAKLVTSYIKELKARRPTLSVILILLYSIPISMTVTISQTVIFTLLVNINKESFGQSCYAPIQTAKLNYVYVARLIETFLLSLAYPVSGWLADIKLGRGKAIDLSLWMSWCGMLILTGSYLFQYSECKLVYDILQYGGLFLGVMFLIVGMANFHTNALAYMTDQMPDASSTQIQSFIRWFTWTLLAGFSCDYIETAKYNQLNQDIILGTFLFTFVMLTILLITHQFTTGLFIATKPIRNNPYKLVLRVVQFAWRHKGALNRSSLTFWEGSIPNRIDLGKRKYGGPFTEEEVENVKSFLKVTVVLLFLGGLFIPYFDLANQGAVYGHRYRGSELLRGYGSYLFWQSFVMMGIILIPVLEFVIIPLFPKVEYFLTSPLKGMIGAFITGLLAIIALLGIKSYLFLENRSNDCYLTSERMDTDQIDVNFLYLIIPSFFIGFYIILSFSEPLQVLCSQAPHEMSGMLMGVFWFFRSVFICVGILIPVAISSIHFICSFWIVAIQFVLTSIGAIVFLVFLRYYPLRKRETVYHNQQVIEHHYEKYLDSTQMDMIRSNTTEDELEKIAGWSDNVVPAYTYKI